MVKTETEPADQRTKVVLSGERASGAYEVGVLKALMSGRSPATGYQDLMPDICAGTSIGSFSAAVLVANLADHGPAAAAELERVWIETVASAGSGVHRSGMYRLRGDPLAYADPRRYFPNPLGPLAEIARDGDFLFRDGLQRLINLGANRTSSLQERLSELFDFASFIAVDPYQQTIGKTIDFGKIRESAVLLRIAATN